MYTEFDKINSIDVGSSIFNNHDMMIHIIKMNPRIIENTNTSHELQSELAGNKLGRIRKIAAMAKNLHEDIEHLLINDKCQEVTSKLALNPIISYETQKKLFLKGETTFSDSILSLAKNKNIDHRIQEKLANFAIYKLNYSYGWDLPYKILYSLSKNKNISKKVICLISNNDSRNSNKFNMYAYQYYSIRDNLFKNKNVEKNLLKKLNIKP
jgi:hypothetical protein